MKTRNWKALALACATATLCACAGNPGTSGTSTRTELSYSLGDAPAQQAQSTVRHVEAQGAGPDAGHTLGIVYFDFDRYDIKPKYRELLAEQARLLRDDPGAHAVVEGHTDQLGSQEYNLALGNRRAEAVRHALTLLGVPAEQLEAVSFGENKPAAPGLDEASRALNRRAELRSLR